MTRYPVNFLGSLGKLLTNTRDANKPTRNSPIQQWGIAAPAKGVGMLESFGSKDQVFVCQMINNQTIGAFKEFTFYLVKANTALYMTTVINSHNHGDVIGLPQGQVVFTKGRRHMQHASTVLDAHKLSGPDFIKILAPL